MQFVIKLVVDHPEIGDVMVGLQGVRTLDMKCYPMADDVNHVILPEGMALHEVAPALAPPKRKLTGPEVILNAVADSPKGFTAIADALQAEGFVRTGTGSLLFKMLTRGDLVQDAQKRYMPGPGKSQKVAPKPKQHRHFTPGSSGETVIIDYLRTGPQKQDDVRKHLMDNGYAYKSGDARLSQMKHKGMIVRTEDGYWMIAPQFLASMQQTEQQNQPTEIETEKAAAE